MEKGKIVLIEGTDCSGKETQSKKMVERLNKEGLESMYFSFPNYSSTTGKIVGLPYLGKSGLAYELVYNAVKKNPYFKGKDIRNRATINATIKELANSLSHGWFKEGATNVDAKVASMLYATDRLYNLDFILETLEQGKNIVMDRYVYSNMAHQGGKIEELEKRIAMYEWIKALEFDFLEMPDTDYKYFLHMPAEYANLLRGVRGGEDEHEKDINYQKLSEQAYLEVASRYGFETIDCIKEGHVEETLENIKSIDDIHEELYDDLCKKLVLK